MESVWCKYTFSLCWQPPCWCGFCTLKDMTIIMIFSPSVPSMQVCRNCSLLFCLFECPRLQSSLYLLLSSVNILSLRFPFHVGYSDKLQVVMLCIGDLWMNLGAISTSNSYIPSASPSWCLHPGIHIPFSFTALLTLQLQLPIPLVPVSLTSSLLKFSLFSCSLETVCLELNYQQGPAALPENWMAVSFLTGAPATPPYPSWFSRGHLRLTKGLDKAEFPIKCWRLIFFSCTFA